MYNTIYILICLCVGIIIMRIVEFNDDDDNIRSTREDIKSCVYI